MGICSLIAGPSFGQQIMDGSDGNDTGMVRAITAQLVATVADPYTAQIRDLRRLDDGKDICGVVNLKNKAGAYTGFQPFIIYSGTLYLQESDQCK